MNKIEIYQAKNGQASIDVTFEKDTIWLTQKQIATIFGTEIPAVNKHIKNVFSEEELIKSSTISKMEIVQKEGNREVKRLVDTYNLDMIISIGYRINSNQATKFRQWATQRLKEHLVNGYSINQQRLEQLQKTIEIIRKIYSTVFEKRPKLAYLLLNDTSLALIEMEILF
jgi:hypothetical protein